MWHLQMTGYTDNRSFKQIQFILNKSSFIMDRMILKWLSTIDTLHFNIIPVKCKDFVFLAWRAENDKLLINR